MPLALELLIRGGLDMYPPTQIAWSKSKRMLSSNARRSKTNIRSRFSVGPNRRSRWWSGASARSRPTTRSSDSSQRRSTSTKRAGSGPRRSSTTWSACSRPAPRNTACGCSSVPSGGRSTAHATRRSSACRKTISSVDSRRLHRQLEDSPALLLLAFPLFIGLTGATQACSSATMQVPYFQTRSRTSAHHRDRGTQCQHLDYIDRRQEADLVRPGPAFRPSAQAGFLTKRQPAPADASVSNTCALPHRGVT